VDAALPLADVQGLSDFSRPHPNFRRMACPNVLSRAALRPMARASFLAMTSARLMSRHNTDCAGQWWGWWEFDGYLYEV